MSSIGFKKEEVRDKFLKLRLKLTDEKVSIYSAMISCRLQKMVSVINAKGVLLYMPIKNEVETKYIFSFCSESKKRLFLPAFNKKAWCISKYKTGDDLISGSFNINQPKKINLARINDCDIALIPGLAFCQNGVRVGYGKGVYDKLLVSSKCIKIGLCYDFQIIGRLKPETNDVPVDIVISEKRVIRIKS